MGDIFSIGGGGGGFGGSGVNLGGNIADFGFGSDSPFFGYERSRREDESTTRPDPLTLRSNELRFNQLQDILGATGGFGALYGPETDKLFQLDPQAQQALQRAIAQSQMPGLTPEAWYSSALAATNPADVIARSQGYLQDIVTPQLQGQYAAMGLGRSGALGESIARAGTQLALPIAQTAQAQRFGIEQQRPNVDVALRQNEIARQFAGFQAADIPRQLELANWQRKAQGLGSAFNLVPYVAGQDSQSTSREFGNIVMDLIGILAPLAMSALTGGLGGGMGMGAGGSTGQAQPSSLTAPYTPPPHFQQPVAPVVPYPMPGPYNPYPYGPMPGLGG